MFLTTTENGSLSLVGVTGIYVQNDRNQSYSIFILLQRSAYMYQLKTPTGFPKPAICRTVAGAVMNEGMVHNAHTTGHQ